MKNLFLLGVIFLLSAAAFAQPRPPETARERSEAEIKPAPESFDARYEGGFFGFSDKQSGRLRFDDANSRFVFFGKDGKEMFGIPVRFGLGRLAAIAFGNYAGRQCRSAYSAARCRTCRFYP